MLIRFGWFWLVVDVIEKKFNFILEVIEDYWEFLSKGGKCLGDILVRYGEYFLLRSIINKFVFKGNNIKVLEFLKKELVNFFVIEI